MGIDVSRFHQTFFDESLEGLEQMESGLLELEVGSDDNEAINTIFRAAHSIKGGAGTLGFAAVAEFTHHVETILDRRRSGQGEVTQETVDVLLSSVDCLRDMLAAAQDGEDFDGERVAEVEARLQDLVNRDGDGGESSGRKPTDSGEPTDATDGGTVGAPSSWTIVFRPLPHLFRTGNDPVRILGELAELGRAEVTVDAAQLPEIEDLDIEVSYLHWTVELRPADDGAIDRAAIDTVFEWVEDDAEITITEIPVEPVASPSTAVADPVAREADTASATGGSESSGPTTDGAATPNGGPPAGPAGKERRSGHDRRQGGASQVAASIRVDIDKVDTLINMVGELVITQSMLQQLAIQGEKLDLDRFREGLAELESNTRELQASVMQIRMLPISFAFNRLPRLVRDLASKLGKTVDLQINGETTELDKTVMEKIGDPLVHLVRNSLDHGIESPQDRIAAGKPEAGTVTLSAFHEGGNIVIEISDDGGGLRPERILAKARERGLVGEDDKLTERQVHDLIFHPGFSTAAEVSDVSGRGVGMDVVKRNIKDLGGVIDVVSQPGEGTTFRIRLPLTLAILDGQVVRVGDQLFIIPLVSIVESLQFDDHSTGSLIRGADVYRHREVAIPLIDLRETFGVDHHRAVDDDRLMVVVDADGTRAGLLVDDLLAQQQIVIKSLTTNFRAVPGLSGATILGDGTVAMIVDVNSVFGLFRQAAVPLPPRSSSGSGGGVDKTRTETERASEASPDDPSTASAPSAV